ncbi:aspartate kinase [Anseongella ginsenosidimutans]|uniref:Aspartokinase n=1 Tax=Anseongella ginsenosidimutans TaxID=496056 RepID=A0A4R3KVH7_9SPHI|nr:aspartate kinase [Anseongella ginsenosidimutans]TCS88369.1 aspartate kinase [Anseongella ginsenosidimutans]
MRVFKFGGASVKNAEGVRNITEIIRKYSGEPLLVVISAMGETTNALEKLCQAFFRRDPEAGALLEEIKAAHNAIAAELIKDKKNPVFDALNNLFVELEWILEEEPHADFNFVYDQIVSLGELLSTRIVAAFLGQEDIRSRWIDARNYIHTDNTYREGRLKWELTEHRIREELLPLLGDQVLITQGFIGSTSENYTTTLGRDGSDYSAAIFAYCLNADSLTIWKDVQGVLNADPKWFNNTIKINKLTYNDAIELSYYGANVIHPKTIKPLQNKNIPLYVRSFLEPDKPGTVVMHAYEDQLPIPCFIFKMNQRLISVHARDFSFIHEDGFSEIFRYFAESGTRINVMQNTAISFSVSVDDNEKVPALVEKLREKYKVLYNTGMELITIRYYNQETIDRVLENKQLYLEQKSRYTVQLVVKEVEK